MYNDLLAQIPGPGGYIAIWKVIFFLALFGFWAWVGQWMDKDAPTVGTNRTFWNNIYLGIGLVILAFWFLLPVPFFVELLMFLVIWSTVVIIYVLHRNAKVPKNQTILTPDHIKWLLSFEERKRKKMNPRLVFITVNDNELPIPYKQDDEYSGYISAEELLHDMWRRRVSHMIMVPHGENYQLRYVIDGIATVEGDRPREEAMESIVYLKAVAGLDVEDHRRPQEGSFFTIRTGQKDTGWRISTSGSTRGEQLSLERIEETKSLKIDVVGLHPDQLEMVQKVIEQPSGIMLVTGSKGNGSTTTLYGLIRHHDAFIQNIHTLEDECLMEVDNISQHEMEKGPKARSGAQQLRSVFHVDPAVTGFIRSVGIEPGQPYLSHRESYGSIRVNRSHITSIALTGFQLNAHADKRFPCFEHNRFLILCVAKLRIDQPYFFDFQGVRACFLAAAFELIRYQTIEIQLAQIIRMMMCETVAARHAIATRFIHNRCNKSVPKWKKSFIRFRLL